MTRRRARSFGALLVAALLVLAGCADSAPDRPDPTISASLAAEVDCTAAVSSIVFATQRYVDSYAAGSAVAASDATGDESASPARTPTPTPTAYSDADFQDAIAGAQGVISERGCDPARVRADLEDGLGDVTPQGAVADAVLRQITASLTGRLSAEPATRAVVPGDDLADVLAELPEGSTITLAAGEYALSEPLVLLTGVTIRGAGRDATTIRSTAPEAALLALTGGRVELADLTVRHEGDAAASALLAGPAASVVASGARFAGGRTDADGLGGAGVLMFAGGEDAAGRGTTLEVTDTELAENQAGGIVLTGGHRASVLRGVFRANVQCGICFLGAVDGSVEDSTFEGNGVGIAVTGTAAPTLLRNAISGGEVGLQASDEAAPMVDGATISGAARAAVIYTGTASGRLNGVTCTDVPFGIVVGPSVAPTLKDNSCDLAASKE